MQPLMVILILLFSSYLAGELFKKMGLPRVVGQISIGMIFGLGFIRQNLLTPDHMSLLSFLANLGAILLFYYVGLETNFKVFKRNIKVSALISIFNTSIPFLLGFLVSHLLFKIDLLPSIIISACLSVSAQSVSVDILEELSMLKSKIGSMIISAGAVDDTIELIFISTLLAILHFSSSGSGLLRFIVGVALFFMVIILSRIWLISFFLKVFGKGKSSTARFTISLLIVLLIASISELFGIGALIGAMIAGMIVRQTIFKDVEIPDWEEHQMASSIHLIAFGFLIPLFFVWVGTKADLSLVAPNLWQILLFSLIALIGTVGGTILAILLHKGSLKEGLLMGWGLTPKGDAELIMASSALALGILNSSMFTSIIVMSLITTIIAPVVFKRLMLRYGEDKNLMNTKAFKQVIAKKG
jgi:Kef-type K+ transport system membrane component KefB